MNQSSSAGTMAAASNKIELRTVTSEDDAFLCSVYASTRQQELAQVPWAEEQKAAFVRMQFEAQQRHYAGQYPNASHAVVCAGGTPVGRIYLDRSGSEFHILDITVLPEYRNTGTGSFILQKILDEATNARKPVTIYVESFNPSLRLFTRLGFLPVQEHGMHVLLRRE